MNVLVTGGASGIGKSIVNDLISKKYNVTVLDRSIPNEKEVKFYCLDLKNEQEIMSFFSSLNEQYDALINAAGVREIKVPHELDIEEWEMVQKINVTAPFVLSKELIKSALKNKKKLSIINISSVSGLLAEPNRVAYVTSKHALIGLTKQLAFEYGKYGIRVNAIAPGVIRTPLTEQYFSDISMVNRLKEDIPLAYWGEPHHLNSLVDVCLTNDYITGSVLVCDGGWSCGKTI